MSTARNLGQHALYLPSKRKLDVIYTLKCALFIEGDTESLFMSFDIHTRLTRRVDVMGFVVKL